MNLSYKDKRYLQSKFPNIKLSYEKTIHKKVFPMDIVMAIPKGKKFFAWFWKCRGKPMCIFLELDRFKKSIKSFNIYHCSFDDELIQNKGTILYGTIFYINKMRFFSIENLYFYKGRDYSREKQIHRFTKINEIFNEHLKNNYFTSKSIIFTIPIIMRKKEQVMEKIKNIQYKIYQLQHRSLYNEKIFINEIVKHSIDMKKIFLVKAKLEDDIYNLFSIGRNDQLEQVDTAYIPDYKTSKMLNSLFRNIKENDNLDLLEESDDEEEFEDISLDKYVDLDKEIKMECMYLEKFKSWVPKIVVEKGNICRTHEVKI